MSTLVQYISMLHSCVVFWLLLCVVKAEVATQCNPNTVRAHPHLNVDKFVGTWYETYQNEATGDSPVMSRIVITKDGADIKYKMTGYADCQVANFDVTLGADEPARLTEQIVVPGADSNPAVIIDTDYDSYALYYQCFTVDASGYCEDNHISILQRCKESLSESKMAELQDMMDAACVDHTGVIPTEESSCFNIECTDSTGGAAVSTVHHLLMLMICVMSLCALY